MANDPRAPKVQRFMTAYQSIAGWNAVEMWWNPEHGGFWEPYDVRRVQSEDSAPALVAAKQWAAESGKPFIGLDESWPKPERYDA